jgi:hypothetical protein
MKCIRSAMFLTSILGCLFFFPLYVWAQCLEKDVQCELCGIGQQYIDELSSLINSSDSPFYPSGAALEILASHRSKILSVFKARYPDSKPWDCCSFKEFENELCTAIRRWGEYQFPGFLTRPDSIEKISAKLLRLCPDLVIPVVKKTP